MHSRICLAAIIVMLLGAASSSYYSELIRFLDERMFGMKLNHYTGWKTFEKELGDWFIRGETDIGLPKSTLTTLDALSAFLFTENHQHYYSLDFDDHKSTKGDLYDHNQDSLSKMIQDWKKQRKDEIKWRNVSGRLNSEVKRYLNLRKTAKKYRREAKLATHYGYENTESGLLLATKNSEKAAENARLQAIEEQKALGKDYNSVHNMDKYEATVLLNTSLLAFMTMLEQKMQDEKAFGALRLVPSLTDAFKLEVLSKEILSAIPKIEIMDWLEEKIKKDIFGVNQKSLPGSTTGKQSPLSVAELASGKTEDLRDYVFTITLLENLPFLFEMA